MGPGHDPPPWRTAGCHCRCRLPLPADRPPVPP